MRTYLNIDKEEWKKIEGIKGIRRQLYISNMGRVQSIFKTERISKFLKLQWERKRHYLYFSTTYGEKEKVKQFLVAREVLKAFFPNYRPRREHIFLDGDPKNCKANNLYWKDKKIKEETIVYLEEILKKGRGNDRTSKEGAFLILMSISINEIAFDVVKLRKMVSTCISRLYKLGLIKSKMDVESLIQDATFKACRGICCGLFRYDKQIWPWIKKITINTIKNELIKNYIKEINIHDSIKLERLFY